MDARIRSRKVAVSPKGVLYMLTDTLLSPGENGSVQYTGEPGGQLLRISRAMSPRVRWFGQPAPFSPGPPCGGLDSGRLFECFTGGGITPATI